MPYVYRFLWQTRKTLIYTSFAVICLIFLQHLYISRPLVNQLSKSSQHSEFNLPSQTIPQAQNDQLRNALNFSNSIVADNITRLANQSGAFTSTFCKHRLSKAKNQPRICLYKPQDDIFVSKSIIESGMWETESE